MCNPRRLSLSIAWGQLAWYSCTLAVLATWAAVVLLHLRTWGLPHVGVGWSERLADLVGGCMHDLSPLYVQPLWHDIQYCFDPELVSQLFESKDSSSNSCLHVSACL